MKRLLLWVGLINVITLAIVFVLNKHVAAFQATEFGEYLFYSTIIIWLLAKLMWEGGIHSKSWASDKAAGTAKFMVKDHNFEQDSHQQRQQNYQLGFILFVAGIPSFIGCLVSMFI